MKNYRATFRLDDHASITAPITAENATSARSKAKDYFAEFMPGRKDDLTKENLTIQEETENGN